MNFSSAYLSAFRESALFEIGPWFDPNDPDTIAGNTGNFLLNRKCGYVDLDGDSGGCTKYGIAQTDNPNVDVKNLNLYQAMQIYYNTYWVAGACDRITIPITIFQFDMCVNNGVPRASKILQQAVGVNVDGSVGPVTLAAVNQQDPVLLINTLSALRTARYNTIAQENPDEQRFLAGWLRRVTEVTQFALAQV